jgi:uncharacterized membrane protein
MQTSVTADHANRKQRLFTIITALTGAGILISSFSLYHHFSRSKTSFCDLGQSFNCDLVNRSEYSTFHGVPVALIGIFGYLLILALATLYRDKAETPFMLLAASVGGTGFALYLTYLEGYVIHAWCILCLSSLIDIILIAVLSAAIVKFDLRSR